MNLSCVSESKRLQGGALASDAAFESVMIIRLGTERAMVGLVCPILNSSLWLPETEGLLYCRVHRGTRIVTKREKFVFREKSKSLESRIK